MLEGLSRFLLDMYRASREIPHAGFKDWVFGHLDRLIPFDSAWWGSGSERPLQVIACTCIAARRAYSTNTLGSSNRIFSARQSRVRPDG